MSNEQTKIVVEMEPPLASEAESTDAQSSHSLEAISQPSGLVPSSKKILRKRKKYHKIDDNIRMKLVEAVEKNGEMLKTAASRYGVNYSSAKSIFHTYRKEGRVVKKNIRERYNKKVVPKRIEPNQKNQELNFGLCRPETLILNTISTQILAPQLQRVQNMMGLLNTIHQQKLLAQQLEAAIPQGNNPYNIQDLILQRSVMAQPTPRELINQPVGFKMNYIPSQVTIYPKPIIDRTLAEQILLIQAKNLQNMGYPAYF